MVIWDDLFEQIELLLQFDADPYLKDIDGNIPRDILKTEEHKNRYDSIVNSFAIASSSGQNENEELCSSNVLSLNRDSFSSEVLSSDDEFAVEF